MFSSPVQESKHENDQPPPCSGVHMWRFSCPKIEYYGLLTPQQCHDGGRCTPHTLPTLYSWGLRHWSMTKAALHTSWSTSVQMWLYLALRPQPCTHVYSRSFHFSSRPKSTSFPTRSSELIFCGKKWRKNKIIKYIYIYLMWPEGFV